MRKFLMSFAALFWLCLSGRALAYPVLINGDDLPWLKGRTLENFVAFAPRAPGTFEAIPLTIDEIEEGAAIVFRNPTEEFALRKDLHKPTKKDPFEGKLTHYHRIVLDDASFGTCEEKCRERAFDEGKKYCGSRESEERYFKVIRVDLAFKKTTAFLIDCQKKSQPEFSSKTNVNLKERTFRSESFEYKFKSDKNILFDSLKVTGETAATLNNAELLVHVKPKYLFNFKFTESDIASRITSYTKSQLGVGVEVAFALNVLGLKINNQICCDISLYNDSLYFPVILDMPFEGSSLKKVSGLFFGFNYTGDKSKLAKFKDTRAIVIPSSNKIIAVGFRNMRDRQSSTTAKVLFPDELKAMGFPQSKSDLGFFYDVSSLKKGFQHFNIWLLVGEPKDEAMLIEYATRGIEYQTFSFN